MVTGTVRAALKYLARDAPRDALAWWKLIDLLEKINWPNVARHLPVGTESQHRHGEGTRGPGVVEVDIISHLAPRLQRPRRRQPEVVDA